MAFQVIFNQATQPTELTLQEFSAHLEAGEVEGEILLKDRSNELTGTVDSGGDSFEFIVRYAAETSPEVVTQLQESGVEFRVDAENPTLFQWFLTSILPYILIFGLFIFIIMQMQGGGNRVMQFGKSKAKLVSKDAPKTTFADVAGAVEAVAELEEIKDFLAEPQKFRAMGAKIPKGVLLYGPPGTGKTLLARAVAGEAGVPFYAISGSDFVEMFVGVGASRVRDMFEQAKKHSPCIIFIDEIDAVGRHRGAGLGGGHDEREQTLNQLLVEMDGFEGNEGVIVIAATNRPDVLDPALLRPGRFDRRVVVPLPDVLGRTQILKVHMRRVPLADNVKAKVIARGTPGFSGADLANLVNEAALFAARNNKRLVDQSDLEHARDKIIMGAERRSMVMSEDEKKCTAYHEAGHAIVGWTVPSSDPIYKVTIVPRDSALGMTVFLPERDSYGKSKENGESFISMAYGGRVAEEMIFGADQVTTGASQDIKVATEYARSMVTRWGLSDLGPLLYGEEQGEVFLGHSVTQHKNISDETAHTIDLEIRTIIDRNYKRAEKVLAENRDKLDAMAEALMKYETIDADQVKDIMEGKTPRPPENWSEDDDNRSNNADSGQGKAQNDSDNIIGGPAGEH